MTTTTTEAARTAEKQQATSVAVTRSAELLHAFAASTAPSVRRSVAAHPHTRPDTLAELSHDLCVSTRVAVAANPRTPLRTLLTLATDAEPWVRAAVAGNPSVPAYRLILLFLRENHPSVRDALITRRDSLRPHTTTRYLKASTP